MPQDDPTIDEPMSAGDVLLLMEPLALEIARRYPRRDGIERDDLMGEAWIALNELAVAWLARVEPDPTPMEKWFADRVRERLRSYVRKTLYAFLERVPPAWRRRVIKVHTATQRCKARGILRPSYDQIAAEAMIGVDVVVMASTFPRVIDRQSLVEWAEDHGQARAIGEPEVVPAFGPQPGFEPRRPCNDIVRHPLPKDSPFVCMGCHQCGPDVERHPAMRRSKYTDPKPEPETAPAPRAERPRPATRRERRKLLFAPRADVA